MNILLTIGLLTFFQEQGLRNTGRENNLSDTTIVGRVIDMDSFFLRPNIEYTGYKYYYGVHHIKVVLIDIANANKEADTLILACVYNRLTETQAYKNGFGLKKGAIYMFYIHPFTPCRSDFPKIQGTCYSGEMEFHPESNQLIKQYRSINRIIYTASFKLD